MIPVLLAVGAVAAGSALARRGSRSEALRQFIKDVRGELRLVAQEVRSAAVRADIHYQKLMVEKVDPMLGRRNQSSGTGVVNLEISGDERRLNRYLGGAVTSMGSAVVAVVYPPALIVTLGAALYSTRLIFREGYRSVVRDRKLGMNALGSLYFVGAYAGGFFIPGSFGLATYYLSEKLLFITQDRSHKSLIQVFSNQPRSVWQLMDGVEVEVPFESVRAGDTIVLQAGDVVPVDGVIIHGNATIDQHQLTGEGQPAEKSANDSVLTSTLMVAGKIHVQVEKTGEETVASQIGLILNKTASYQAGIVTKGEQLADRSVPPTILLAVIALPLAGYRYMVTILGAAIGLNIRVTAPIAMLNFLNIAAHRGILVKDGRSLELLRDVDTVVFDKTGTLTLEQPVVAQIHACMEGVDGDAVLTYAAAAERRQTHPIARAILAEAGRRGLVPPEIEDAQYEVGYGLRVRTGGRLIRVGSRRFMALENIDEPEGFDTLQQSGQEQGHSMILVAIDDRLAGAIELQPALRPEARDIVRELRSRNLDLYIISGDQEQATRRMAQALDIPNYFADTLPESKADLVERLQAEGHIICFVGDGINDAIALKKAHVSVSLRGASTAATDTAQIVLMAESLRQLPFAFDLAREFETNMKAGAFAAVSQGVIVIGGALLSIVGIVGGTVIWAMALLAGVGIAMQPLHKHHLQLTAGPSSTKRN